MYLCKIIDIDCNNCPFNNLRDYSFKDKDIMIAELQDIFDSAKWALEKLKEAD